MSDETMTRLDAMRKILACADDAIEQDPGLVQDLVALVGHWVRSSETERDELRLVLLAQQDVRKDNEIMRQMATREALRPTNKPN